MIDLSLIHAISYRQLLLQRRCELLKLCFIHPRELCLVIFVKFFRAQFKNHVFIVLGFLDRLLILLAKGYIDGNEFTVLLFFPGFVVLSPLLLVSLVVI